jgi:hypothetical protein
MVLLAATTLIFTGCRGFPKYVEHDTGQLIANSKVGQPSTREVIQPEFSAVHPNPSINGIEEDR